MHFVHGTNCCDGPLQEQSPFYGADLETERRPFESDSVGAIAPTGTWIQKWVVKHDQTGFLSIQSVLNTGDLLEPPLQHALHFLSNNRGGCGTATINAPTPQGFTSVHGR